MAQTKEYKQQYYLNNKDKWRKYQAKARSEYPEKVMEYHYNYKKNSTAKYLLKSARTRAKKRGLEFNLDLSDIVIPEQCPYMREPFVVDQKGIHPMFPSVDRIDSSKGYVKGNIQIISVKANHMKWDATPQQLIQFALGVLEKEGIAPC